MDAVSVLGERDDAEITDASATEGPAQSEIPKVSLCPPDSEDAESPTYEATIEGEQVNNLSRSASSSQLYDQVSQSCAYQSPQLKRCPCCGHHHQITGNVGLNHVNASSHSDCSTNAVKTVHRCSPFHQPMCHNTMQCHWLQGSRDGSNYKPVQHHVVTVRTERLHRIPKSYSQVIVEYPMTVLISCVVLLLTFSLVGILIGPLPDFSDPLSGFEPRGTDIGIRMAAWTKLQESTGPGRALSLTSQQFADKSIAREVTGRAQHHFKHRSRRMLHRDSAENTFFCNAPGDRYAQLVFRSGNSASLWSLKAIYSMCEMEQTQLRSDAHFEELCQVKSEVAGSRVKRECCPSWSLGNFLALLNNVSSCFSLTAQQVSDSLNLLRYCAPYYHDGSLVASCAERGKHGYCASVPHDCKRSSVIFQILHYLVDKDFLGPQTVKYQVPSLKYSVLFLPVTKGDELMKIYLEHLEGNELTHNNTTITGMDLGIKQKLFKYYLSRDSIYPILTVLALLMTMALYLKSLFLSVMSLAAVTLSLLTSYFFYKVVFGLTFFPLLNLAAILILLGSCSNQAFTFIDFWKLQLSHNPPATLEKRMHRVLQEMGYLILVSGLTSSITFYSGYISSIPVVRCFAVYLGSASLINTLFALVWLPCTVVLQERYTSTPTFSTKPPWKPCCSKIPGGFWHTSSRKRCLFTMGQKIRALKRGLTDTSNLLFLKFLPCGVVKFRYIWVCWFAVLAAGGIYISCVDPGMKLPSSDSGATQLFRSSHPFERYDAEYRHQFMFERIKQGEDEPMTLTLIWGVVPTDDSDHFLPKSNGSFAMDPEFNMTSPEAQEWLRDLCGKIRNQSFYPTLPADHEAVEDNTCFVVDLIHWVSIRRCSESEDAFSFCCNNISFPYPPDVFEQCLKMMMGEQQAERRSAKNGGLRFDSHGQIAALVVVFKTKQHYSFNFNTTSHFYSQIASWFNKEIAGAPKGLQKGWFVSQLSLYDLQQCLSTETLEVAGFSVALTFSLLLLTTWNIPLSIYVTVAVGGSVFATIGLLVLLEWQLNSVEALFISAAAGLSVDFAANYCISYCLAPHNDRLGRVAHSLKRMGCPVAIGAGAYFCVGIIMLPATALLFRKLGIFLLLVKCVACGFATFFFQSLCCFFGPQKNCGKIIIPCATERATENTPPSCTAAEPGTANPSANGAFGCGTGSRCRKSSNKEGGGGFLCPNQQRHRQQQAGVKREPEQYELQPLACHLSDSFENSTCTSKLSNRPSVLSDDIEFCGLSPKRDYDRISMEADSEEMGSRHLKGCNPPPALQTSSPYKGNILRPVVAPPSDPAKERLLCKKCRGQSVAGIKLWNASLSSSSSMEDVTGTETTSIANKRSLSMDGATTRHPHKRLLSCQSQSSFEGLEDSNETCLSDIEPAVPAPPSTATDGELRPGHLNGKRDTLRLSLRETVYDLASPGSGRGRTSQSDLPVILPNSKPDMPDVWVKRDGRGEDSS